MFPVHTVPGKFKNTTITDDFGFLFEENLFRENTLLSQRHRFLKKPFSKCFLSTRNPKAGVLKFLRFHERFHGGLVWKAGLNFSGPYDCWTEPRSVVACLVLVSVLMLSVQCVTGELGGNMGLLLGCSILTLFEFIDFLSQVVASKIQKRSRDDDTEPNNGHY